MKSLFPYFNGPGLAARGGFPPGAVALSLGLLAGFLPQAEAQTRRGEVVWVDSIPAGAESPALKKDFSRCLEVLRKMDKDMDLFNLDKIHPHLEDLYRVYAEMTGLLPRWDPGNRTGILADIGKVKDRTEVIHRLFDSGEMEVSQRYLRDLILHGKRLERRFGEQDAAKARSMANPSPAPASAPAASQAEGRTP